jgi:hypothetical protein
MTCLVIIDLSGLVDLRHQSANFLAQFKWFRAYHRHDNCLVGGHLGVGDSHNAGHGSFLKFHRLVRGSLDERHKMGAPWYNISIDDKEISILPSREPSSICCRD